MSYLIKNARVVNEGKVVEGDVRVKGKRIDKIAGSISEEKEDTIIDIQGNFLLPGIIDDQVHFREPGLTHKATIGSESKAAVAGGITSFMEMPNTVPPALSRELLEEKYQIAARTSLANYSFFMGVSNDNSEEVLRTDPATVCGIKIFMGSSTGNMLVDKAQTLEEIFSKAPTLIAVHCEDEETIKRNIQRAREEYGSEVPMSLHPVIRSAEACYKSSSFAVELAKKNGTRLHILHISTARELDLFDSTISLKDKKITAEACVHHLWFDDRDYEKKGSLIKWNPAVKRKEDKEALFQAVLDDKIDVIATDHAPHTLEEKQNSYFNAPSGGPLVQHSLPAMMEFVAGGKISIERVVEKMAHNPAILFEIKERGYIREGYYADLTVVDPRKRWTVSKQNILAKCGWSPFEGHEFGASVVHTFVSGQWVYREGILDENARGMRLHFNRG